MITSELRDILTRFVSSELSVEQIEDWIVPRLATLIEHPDSANSQVAAAVELALAELSTGIRSEAEARSLVKEALDEQRLTWVEYPEGTAEVTTSATAAEERVELNWAPDSVITMPV